MHIETILQQICPLPQAAVSKLKEHISECLYPKGHIILKAGRIEDKLYFIKKGIVRAYAPAAETDITFWFGKEGQAVISMKSYVQQQKAYEHIELLEDCELYRINTTDLQELYARDIHIANWGRKFAEQELIQTEERLISRQFRTATQRYKDLLQEHPDLIQRVPLGYIASYLGITQVSLSRIRAEIK